MFLSYFEPIYFRNKQDCYIHYFYKQIQDLGAKNCYFLVNEDFFKPIEVWESRNCPHLSEETKNYHMYEICNNQTLLSCKKSIIPYKIFDELLNKIKEDKLLGEKILLTEVYEPLKQYFDKTIKELLEKIEIEAILTIKNCPSLEVVAKKYNIPVIHYEIAALRSYTYEFLAYYDLKGVNGCTSVDINFEQFKNEYRKKRIKLLSNKDILNLFARNINIKKIKSIKQIFEVGGALQVFNDSNLIAFSNGYDSNQLVDLLVNNFDEDEILIRNHPYNDAQKLLSFKNLDYSTISAEFIAKCKKILTINSSIAFEASLYDKPVYILGDSPFKMLSAKLSTLTDKSYKIKNTAERKLLINYLTFVYMIPYDLIFNVEYLRYRLKNPALIDLYKYHFNYYVNKYQKLRKEKHIEQRIEQRIEQQKRIQRFFDNIKKTLFLFKIYR